jgi:hypothetical protein
MSFEAAAAAAPPPTATQAGYGAALADAGQFNQALGAASAVGQPAEAASAPPTEGLDAIRPAMKGVMEALESVNGEASDLGKAADAAQARGTSMSPGEMVMLSMRCQEFMFHCQLTSNIANRTSDGLQQLFRQQG